TGKTNTNTLTYQIGTRHATTVLRLHDGETQILAGLISNEDRNVTNKIPGLGDFPLLGRLFSNKNDTKNKSEIVLLITPHVIRNITRPAAERTEFLSGTDMSAGRKIVLPKEKAEPISNKAAPVEVPPNPVPMVPLTPAP
ncbi:MAG: type II and III secretion system protein, partial [Gallionella sp.]|nr:type II and III secretion system protein [Gallionella sp.]